MSDRDFATAAMIAEEATNLYSAMHRLSESFLLAQLEDKETNAIEAEICSKFEAISDCRSRLEQNDPAFGVIYGTANARLFDDYRDERAECGGTREPIDTAHIIHAATAMRNRVR